MTTDYAARAHFNDYWPPDFGWGGRLDPEVHADMLVPFHHSNVNFGQVHKYAAELFTVLLDELVPHIDGGLVAGKCWGYSTTDNLPDGTRSFHSFGLAIDVNWHVNHMGTNIPDAHGKGAIPRGPATAIAHALGIEWGGNWRGGYHDNMHFECHLSPADARQVRLTQSPTTDPLEETIMALYGSKAEFETALRGIVHDEVNAALAAGVTVKNMQAWDDNDGKPGRDPHNPETLFMGIPGYQTVGAREAGKPVEK